MALPILTVSNAKLLKGSKHGYLTAGIHFAPASLSGHNVCPMSSAGCRFACLNTSGHGRYQRTQKARLRKTNWFFDKREDFMARLMEDIHAIERKAKRENTIPALRLNLTSDIQWENVLYQGKTIFEHFPHIQFYDYTKIVKRVLPGSKARAIPNYHLTFSRSESNQALVELAMSAGANVAVVFSSKNYPKQWHGREVVSGDDTDLRFLDKKGVVVGLYAKERAKHDKKGFVVPTK